MKHYVVARLDAEMRLEMACVAQIDDYPWDESGYKPEATARVGWDEAGLHVLMRAREETISAQETRTGGMVSRDSCLEFFVMPFPAHDDRYLNVEVNPNGVVHLGIGSGRHGRQVESTLPEGMNVTASGHEIGAWAVSYLIPTAYLKRIFGREIQRGQRMRGNFYACDESIHPHFGTWNPVKAPHPDFHRPECFGEMMTE